MLDRHLMDLEILIIPPLLGNSPSSDNRPLPLHKPTTQVVVNGNRDIDDIARLPSDSNSAALDCKKCVAMAKS